ncbi:hypothetical protein TNCV_4653331 [Trichonephila clavipes]|nr:hypothetical protein TNCV_4653331 [Trichonephila clavipes]
MLEFSSKLFAKPAEKCAIRFLQRHMVSTKWMACALRVSSQGLENISLPFSLHAEIVEVEIEVMSPSIVPSGNFAELNRTVTCMVLKSNDRRTSCPCHDEFRGPRFDYVRQSFSATSMDLSDPDSLVNAAMNSQSTLSSQGSNLDATEYSLCCGDDVD